MPEKIKVLRKETHSDLESQYYEKEYDNKGRLILEEHGYSGDITRREYIYDEKGLLLKEIEKDSRNNDEKKYESLYQYDNENYRVTKILKEKRNYFDLNTYENLVLGEETWHKVDEVCSIHEFKFMGSKNVSERFIDIVNRKTKLVNKEYNGEELYKETVIEKDDNARSEQEITRHYSDDRIIKEIVTTNKTTRIIEFEYLGELLIERRHLENGLVSSRTTYSYNRDLIEAERTFSYYNGTEYLAFETNYDYDSQSRLVKHEVRGLYNSMMLTSELHETSYEGNTIIKKGGHWIDSYDLGYYNLDELNLRRREEEESSKDELNEFYVDTGVFEYSASTYNNEIQYHYLIKETYDHRNNKVSYTSLNPQQASEVYDSHFYHNDYNSQGLLIKMVCYRINKDLSIEQRYVKEFEYH